MRYLKILYFLIGVALLVVIVAQADIAEVARRVAQIGWGAAVVLGLYFVTFLVDSFIWQLALLPVPLNGAWLYRLWQARLVGEAFNVTMPAGGMGGEPVKAVLLKKYHHIDYREGAASLILAKTMNMIGLVIFLCFGFALMLGPVALPDAYRTLAGYGLFGVTGATLALFAVQRYRLSSVVAGWASRWPPLARIAGALHHIHDVEDHFARFYGARRARFAGAVLIALANWILGMLEIWFAMYFLGHPVSLAEAWVIESVAQLVRAGTFFIPASIGAQEGAFLLISAAITGSPELGIAFAVVRRGREIIWVGLGFLAGSIYSLTPAGALKRADATDAGKEF